jgi:hypothetical protein
MTEQNTHLDEGTIHAWLDGALSPDESARVEAHAAQCATCGALVAEARGLIAASSRILSSLDAVPAGVIPGSPREGDQLAALRARRTASRRRWFRDPRFVAAASLVFMAGTAGVVWQATREDSMTMEMASEPMVADQVQAPAPSPVATPSAPPASPPETKSPGLARDVAARRAFSDSVSSAKVAANDPAGEARGVAGAAANEQVRRERVDAVSSRQAPAQAQAGAPTQTSAAAPPPAQIEQQSRLQGLGAAQGVLPRRISTDTNRVAAAPAERSFKALSPGTGAALRLADAFVSSGGCYELRLTTEARQARAVVPDLVQLLDEQVPVLSDPAWFRARTFGAAFDSTLAWRSIDSITVELRSRNGGDSAAVRFLTTGALPDVQALTNVRAAAATRVTCR